MLKFHKTKIFLIDPSPYQTAAMLQDEVGRKIIVGNFKWNILCKALISALKMYSLRALPEKVQEIIMNYKRLQKKT